MNKFIDRTLKKFNAADISFVIERWEFLAENFDVSAIPTKKTDFIACVNRLLRTSKVKITKTNIGQLELLLAHKNASDRVWKVFRATRPGDSDALRTPFVEEFQNAISSSMDVLMTSFVGNDVAWIWLDIAPNASRPKLAYVVHPLGTEFLFLSGTLGPKEESVLGAFEEVLHADAVVPLKLSGRCIQSMYEMAVQTYPQNDAYPRKIANVKQQRNVAPAIMETASRSEISQPPKKRRVAENGIVPLRSSTRERRPQSTSPVSAQQREETVRTAALVDTDQTQRRAEIFDIDQTPVLENIEYNMKTNFRGLHKNHEAYAELSKEQFHCQVTFSGQHVVKGLRQLAIRNLAGMQVNNLAQQIVQSARSNFTIENS